MIFDLKDPLTSNSPFPKR